MATRRSTTTAVDHVVDAPVVFDILAAEEDVQKRAADAPKFTMPVLNSHGERRVIELIDAKTLPWQVLVGINNPIKFLGWCIADEDQEDFFDHTPCSGETFRQLAESYREFYNITDQDYGGSDETVRHLEQVRAERRRGAKRRRR